MSTSTTTSKEADIAYKRYAKKMEKQNKKGLQPSAYFKRYAAMEKARLKRKAVQSQRTAAKIVSRAAKQFEDDMDDLSHRLRMFCECSAPII